MSTLIETLTSRTDRNEIKISSDVDFQNLTVRGTSALSDRYNKTNIDNLLLEKAPLAYPSFVGRVTAPTLTVVFDATVNRGSIVNGDLYVSGAAKKITARRIEAPPAITLELGGTAIVGQ